MHHLLQFFAYAHLPPHLQEVSKPFGELATRLVTILPPNSELTDALHRLLESKDCAVRALLWKNNWDERRPPEVEGSAV